MSVHECRHGIWAVGTVGIDARNRCRAQHLGSRLHLPKQLLRFGEAIVVEVLDLHDVQPSLRVSAIVRFHRPNGPQAVPDTDRLTHFWWWRMALLRRVGNGHAKPANRDTG